ncbi:uncharacterized protein [Dermacentor albipictus]|uniref:uncharacterized protein n=1 Tax=Dermacentor albipictus TaxID=60249 RepID=UPI0038FC75D2
MRRRRQFNLAYVSEESGPDACPLLLHARQVGEVKEEGPHFLEHLNSFEPSIQFTAEEENNGRIPFLDVLVERTSGGLKTSVYRKPTHTEKYLSFDSAHPIGQKRSVTAALFSRAFRVCSSPTKRRQELQAVKRDLLSNGYPPQLLRTQERKAAKPRRETAKETGKRAAVPYTVGTSEALARIFKGYGVQIAHVPSRKLGQQLVRAKDPLQHADYPGVIYKIPCKECDVSYISESGNFKRRLRQHMNDVAKGHTAANALVEHHELTGHIIDWDSAAIIANE